MDTSGQVDRALDSRSKGLGFDSQCWQCVDVSGKLCTSHCLGPTSSNGYLVYRSKVGSIVAGCCAPTARGGKVCRTCVVTWISGLLKRYRYPLQIYTFTWTIQTVKLTKHESDINIHFMVHVQHLFTLFSKDVTILAQRRTSRFHLNLFYDTSVYHLFSTLKIVKHINQFRFNMLSS